MNAQAVLFEGPKNIKLSKLEVNEMVEGGHRDRGHVLGYQHGH